MLCAQKLKINAELLKKAVGIFEKSILGEAVWKEFGIQGELDFVMKPLESLEMENKLLGQVFKQLGIAVECAEVRKITLLKLYG